MAEAIYDYAARIKVMDNVAILREFLEVRRRVQMVSKRSKRIDLMRQDALAQEMSTRKELGHMLLGL